MDKALLRYFIDKVGLNSKAFAEKMGMSERTVQNKLSGKTEFTASELTKLTKVCDMSKDDLCRVFFADDVA